MVNILETRKESTIIFPNQLYLNHPGLLKKRNIYLVEDQFFFSDFFRIQKFHKKKLIFHRASMRAYYDFLVTNGYNVSYIDFHNSPNMDYLFNELKRNNIKRIYVVELNDHILEKRFKRESINYNIEIIELSSPAFICTNSKIKKMKSSKHYSQTKFYIKQRKRLKILVKDEKPIGGKWSFDLENRLRIPKNFPVPNIPSPKKDKYIEEAMIYVEKLFSNNPGSKDNFFYPITHEEAEKWFDIFLKERLRFFGDYQDAIVSDQPFLFHSLISPLLNVGLLTPIEIIQKTISFANDNEIPLNSMEGFLRQIVGWREFIHAIYVLEGSKQRTTNFWKFNRKMPRSLYEGTTGILPVDKTIKKVQEYAYAHHIERLMILGNFMLLCEINPEEVYKWFMEFYIDSYDWVMIPNVYGMSQYADGGLITTKPYISSSNYIRKMSNFPKGNWCEIWDGLYWRFIYKHKDFFRKNIRMSIMVRRLEKMDKEKKIRIIEVAEQFLKELN